MSSPKITSSELDDRLLFPACTDPELELLEADQAFEEWQHVTKLHPGGKCPPSLEGGHCLSCQHLTGDPHYVWRRLMVINRNPPNPTK